MPRIAIIGPGAIGSTVLVHLSQSARHTLLACVRTPFSHFELETPDGAVLTAEPAMATAPESASPVDWVLVATKTYDVPAAVAWLPGLVGPMTHVAVLQNGVEHVARFAPHVARERIVPVVVDCPAERSAPGRVRQRGPGWMLVPDSPAGRDFAGLFDGTSLQVKTTDDWTTAAWRKLCLNAAGVVSALTLQPNGIVHNEAIAEIMRGIAREVIAVGQCEGAQLDDTLADTIIATCRHAPPDAVNSIHADRLARRPMEIDARNGVIVRLGKRHGIATPYNQMAVALLSA